MYLGPLDQTLTDTAVRRNTLSFGNVRFNASSVRFLYRRSADALLALSRRSAMALNPRSLNGALGAAWASARVSKDLKNKL